MKTRLVLAGILLGGCSDPTPPSQTTQQENWSTRDELLFQQREVLQHSLEELKARQAENQSYEAVNAASMPGAAPTTNSAAPAE